MFTWYNKVMSKYFDKDFFKFSLGFATIISISLIILIFTRVYGESTINENGANVIETQTKQQE